MKTALLALRPERLLLAFLRGLAVVVLVFVILPTRAWWSALAPGGLEAALAGVLALATAVFYLQDRRGGFETRNLLPAFARGDDPVSTRRRWAWYAFTAAVGVLLVLLFS